MDIRNNKLQPGSFLARRNNILLIFTSGSSLRAIISEIWIRGADDTLSRTLEEATFCSFRARGYF